MRRRGRRAERSLRIWPPSITPMNRIAKVICFALAVATTTSASYNPTTGLISGTPTAAATTNVTFTATNAGGTGEGRFVLTVQ